MFQLLPEEAQEFRLQSWRESIAYRRELIRVVALHAVDCKIKRLRTLTDQLRQLVHFTEMSRKDQNNFEQPLHHLRVIARGWRLLDRSDQARFRAGEMPPSTAAKLIKNTQEALAR